MPDSPAILSPAGFVPEHALAFADPSGRAVRVGAGAPLPVRTAIAAAGSIPLAGTASASGAVGPFTPELGRAIWLTLSGTWTGKAQVMRSIDGGATLLPLTVGGQEWASFTANANEAVGEESVAGAAWYLAITLASGTLAYRVQQ